ncbi:MAG: 50S ribosomal protein L5 [Nanoarchaeota archaeon]|nr:50S ribosomal protein L5 [Nanoarchaeota archaeon]
MKQELKQTNENAMRKIKLEKVVLSCGATGPDLEKSKQLLEMLTDKKAQIVHSGPKRRIPNFGVKPMMPLGTMVTLRGKDAVETLRRMFVAIDNRIKKKQIAKNNFSFGIQEYIEIPGVEYRREIGIRGLNVTATFIRSGVRVKRKKIKSSKLPEKQNISKEEIVEFIKETFNTEVI